jgi:hypothetical protein
MWQPLASPFAEEFESYGFVSAAGNQRKACVANSTGEQKAKASRYSF